jgi:ferredoxin
VVAIDDRDHGVDPGASPAPGTVRIRAHPGLCAGWGNCHRWAPSVYPLDDNGELAIHHLEVGAEFAGDARLGASACPQQAITVVTPYDDKAGPEQREPNPGRSV